MPASKHVPSSLLCPARRRPARTLRLAVAAAVAIAVAIGAPQPASAARDIPVAGAGVNDQNLKNSNWRYAIRFVVDEDTSMYRFMSGFKAMGANGVFASQGSGTYGRGDGGLVRAQLVTVKADGTPNTANVLGQETVSAQQRYAESKSEYGVGGVTQFWHFNMGGVQLKRDTMYAMVYSNVSPDPANNYFSTNSPTMKESEVGPNGRNNLDPNAPGAIGGLDAREAVAWSTDAGSSWVWGRLVGQGYYTGSATSDDGTRLPWYAWHSPLRRGRRPTSRITSTSRAAQDASSYSPARPARSRSPRLAAMRRLDRVSASSPSATCDGANRSHRLAWLRRQARTARHTRTYRGWRLL